jgi:hypothetical protein
MMHRYKTQRRKTLMNTRLMTRLALCLAVCSLTAVAELGIAQPVPARTTGQVMKQGNGNGNSNSNRNGNGNSNSRDSAAHVSITTSELRRLAVANNLTGYRALPPGIQRNLARGKPLPPGIARKMVPGGMLGSLPVVAGHEWGVTGTDLVLIELGTMLVIEVFNDVFQ